MILINIILLILASVLSFIFSGIETGVFSINRSRIRLQVREGNNAAALLLNFQREPENFYLTVLLGNAIANGVFAVVLILLLLKISSAALFWSLFLEIAPLLSEPQATKRPDRKRAVGSNYPLKSLETRV